MPAIFGAFGNFLLPTQLGVHDVAFPRLNSAAFWFLPGGLIMLCQLVCTDRRYARMNCFNIRELQGILKRRFFVDLINSHEYKDILNTTMLGLKYKTNNKPNLDLDSVLFYKFGTLYTGDTKTTIFLDRDFTIKRSYISLDAIFLSSTMMNTTFTTQSLCFYLIRYILGFLRLVRSIITNLYWGSALFHITIINFLEENICLGVLLVFDFV
jgi:hypothetical protein